jgi:cytochrome P450
MEFFVGIMVNYPEVQAKVRAELDSVLGKRSPTLEDEERLSYLCATLKEVMRLYPVASFARILKETFKLAIIAPNEAQL